MRISIIGLPGSGKSTLARLISERFSVPHIHIDRFWFEAGGRDDYNTPGIENVRAKVKQKVSEAISSNEWVSDGVYSRVQPEIARRADLVIFLDIPVWRRLLNHTKRLFQRSNRHKETSIVDDLQFYYGILRRQFTALPKIRRLVIEFRPKVVILRSRREIDEFLRFLKK